MKSPAKKTETNELVLQWDHAAESSPPSGLSVKNRHTDGNQRTMEEYFRFLDEIKPHKKELTDVKLYGVPFVL